MKKAISILLVCMGVLYYACKQTKKNEKAADQTIIPVSLPNPGIPGFHFPTDSQTIDNWINHGDSEKMVDHSWGIWTAMTSETNEKINNQTLRVFETWATPEELSNAVSSTGATKNIAAVSPKTHRKVLHGPRQFLHSRSHKLKMEALPSNANPSGVYQLLVTITYDPPAANFASGNKLFDSSTLQNMLTSGATGIPDFPDSAITDKPTYEIIPKAKIDKGGYFPFRVWTGPNDQLSGYGQQDWPGIVYVDTTNKSHGDGSIDMNNKGRKPEYTYNLNDFIWYTLDSADAAAINAQPGDLAILVGMHVTSKETKRWVWQTFWWTPDPKNPPAPSNAYTASRRPSQLKGAPAHYAMAIAYSFTTPNQPYTGGNKEGKSIYAFNPFLEAPFDTSVFYTPGLVGPTVNRVGCQTNCMSCHAIATFQPNMSDNALINSGNYIPNTYIDMVKDSNFKNTLQLDFLWSIRG